MQTLRKLLFWALLGVLVYVPFHALISTYLISNYGHSDLFKAFKDVVVALAGLGVAVLAVIKRGRLTKTEKYLLSAIGLFVALHLLLIPFSQNGRQVIAGLDVNLRYLIFFCSLYFLSSTKHLARSISLTTWCVLVVCVFGFLQIFVLPKDFLTHFGYGPSIIQPYQLIDSDQSTVRIISTLRGSNSLGAYLIIGGGILAAGLRKKRKVWLVGLVALVYGVTLLRAYSRAAWVGVVVASLIFVWLKFKDRRAMMLKLMAVCLVLLVFFVGLFRNHSIVQKTIFHRDPQETNQVNSDDVRLNTLSIATKDILKKPFGHGVGSSGIASTQAGQPYIIENYFLEIAYQLGVVGGLLLAVIYWLVIRILYERRSDPVALMLLSSFIGLIVASMFWPVFSDETVAYTWWGLTGLFLGTSFQNNPVKLESGKA